jgi:hypothetical protein
MASTAGAVSFVCRSAENLLECGIRSTLTSLRGMEWRLPGTPSQSVSPQQYVTVIANCCAKN